MAFCPSGVTATTATPVGTPGVGVTYRVETLPTFSLGFSRPHATSAGAIRQSGRPVRENGIAEVPLIPHRKALAK